MLPNKSLQGKGLCTYKDTACSAYGGTTAHCLQVQGTSCVCSAEFIVLRFFDNAEDIVIPDDLKEYLDDVVKTIDTIDLVDMSKKAAASVAAIQDPEQYLKDNREMFEWYKEVKASDAYKNTPGYRLQELFAQLNRENGYNDIFIPAMRRLSSSYREYYEKLLKANEVFLKSYRGVRI